MSARNKGLFKEIMLRRLGKRTIIFKYCQYSYGTVSASVAPSNNPKNDKKEADSDSLSASDRSQLVASAFASLKQMSANVKSPNFVIEEEITAAKNIDSLLSVAENPRLSRSNALQIVTILSNWASRGKINLSDFETDIRFAKVCRILGRSASASSKEDMADLSVVLGVTADEQAAKLVSSISPQQMINILTSLRLRKRRSTPLLRSLAFNIGRTSEKLDLKQASDVFYSLAMLNYPEEVLLEKISDDIRTNIKENAKPAVVGSIITSLGIMRYRNTDLLDDLHNWIIQNHKVCRSKEYYTLLLTLASVNYRPENFSRFYKVLKPHLHENEMIEINTWVSLVWSLIVLEEYDNEIIDSVLNPTFLPKLTNKIRGKEKEVDVSTKLKLQNINGMAKVMGKRYEGHLLDENSIIFDAPVNRTNEKQILLNSIIESLSNMVEPDEYIKLDENSGMGFLIDAICLLDSKKNFVKLTSKEVVKDVAKVAIMVCTFHDTCRGCREELNGMAALTHRLLRDSGYRVVPIQYSEYSPRDKLINRVQYLNRKIKELSGS